MIANRAKRINHFYRTFHSYTPETTPRLERKQIRCCRRWRRPWWPFGGSTFVQESFESEGFREKENSRNSGTLRRVFSCQSRDGEACPESQESRCNRRSSGDCRHDMSFHPFDKSERT